jgi:hypothetical protein
MNISYIIVWVYRKYNIYYSNCGETRRVREKFITDLNSARQNLYK